MATQASEVAGSGAAGVVEQLQRLIERFGLIAAGLVGLAGSVAALWGTIQPEIRWGVISLAAAALLFVAVGNVLVPAIQARRRRKVIAIPEVSLRGPTTFRLKPYEEADHDGFDRPDGAHAEALRWLQKADQPFLYLTGFSGTGKSSLLHAWLVPELAKADPRTLTLVVRSYADPGAQLTEALVKEGVIADAGAPGADPHALLERAAATVHPARLLVAIDQFEEALILQDEAGREQLAALFRALAERPIPGLTVLLVLRTDYLDFDKLQALGLPDVRGVENWFTLKALDRGAARELLDQRLKLDESEREKVLDEASEVDDLPGLIRPITLNMLGLILQRARGGVLADTAPGRLIQDYLRNAMTQPGIDDLAPRLLERMITDQGTKRPIDEPSLAEATGAERRLVRKALLLLAEEGVVRELDPARHVWEISHDFVARQLGQIIHRLRPSLLRRLQAQLAPVALVAWLVLLPMLAFAGPEIMERMALNALSYDGVAAPWSEELGGYVVDFGPATHPGAFVRLHGWLRWLRPIRSLTIAKDAELTDLKALYDVVEPGEITQLMISDNPALERIEGLGGLGALTQLTIASNDALQRIEVQAGLDALTELTISFNPALERIEGLGGLGALTQLQISGDDALQRIEGLVGLRALTALTITYNPALERIEVQPGMGKLTELKISYNPALQRIEGLAGLRALTSLEISDNDALERIEGLAGLGALTRLEISDNEALERIEGLGDLGALTWLEISYNRALERIEGLGGLGALAHLMIAHNDALERIEGLGDLSALTWLAIADNDALERIDGLADLGALTQLAIANNDALERIDGLAGLGTLAQLIIWNNDALERIEGLVDLEKVEELRVEGTFLPAALVEVAKLPALRRLMLPVDLQGTGLERAKALPPVEVRYVDPNSDAWWRDWKPGEF